MNNAFRVPLRAQGGMPEYHSQSIGPQAGANVSARYDDRAAGIMLAQASRNAQADAQGWEQFNTGLQGFLKAGVGLYNDYRDKTSRALVDEALLRAREEMEAWRTDYDKTHQGQDGLQAAADYQQQWQRISETRMKGLRDQGVSGPYEQLANLHLRENGLHYNNQGAQFQRQQDKAWNASIFEGQKAELARAVQNDPDNAAWHGFLKAGALDAYRRLHPGEDTSKLEHELDNLIATNRIDTKIAAKDYAGAERDLAVFSGSGQRGDRVAQFESGGQGVRAIGYDKNGGTSYGKYQLSSKQGSYQEWLDYLGKQGAEGAAVAGRLKAAGGFNTGSRSGAAVEAYRKEAEANPELFERTQREYVEQTHYGPMLAKLPAAERAMIEGNAGLQEMAWSVAVQHGGAGGAKLLSRAWKDGMTGGELVDAVYAARGGHFGSSTPEVQASVQRRFGKEAQLIRGMLNGPALTPKQQAAYQGQLDHIRRQQAQEAGLTAQAFGNHLEYGLDKGDFTAAEKDVEGLRSLGFTKEAAELADRLELSRTAYAALTDAGDLPLVEQGAAAKKRLDGLVTPDNAKAATAMRDSVDKALAAKQAAFVKDPAAYVAALPAMQGEMSTQERVSRSLVMQSRMGKGLPYAPRILGVEQAKLRKRDYDKLDSPATRVQWLQQVAGEYGPYAHLALEEMKVPSQVVSLLSTLGRMNEKGMGLALTALEVKDSDIPGLTTDARRAAQDAAANNPHMQRIREFVNAFPANDGLRQFGKGWETMLTNYVKLGGNLEDFDQAFESSTAKGCFLLLPRNAEYSVDDVADATDDVRESLRAQLLADVKADTEQGRIARANLTGLIRRGLFVSDETGTKVTLIDPQHGRPVKYADGTLMQFDIPAIVRERRERNQRLRLVEATDSDAMQVTED